MGIATAPFILSNNLIWSLLEIQVSLTLLDALDAALQLVQELRVDVLEVVLDALPAFGGYFGGGVVNRLRAKSTESNRARLSATQMKQ